MSELLEAELAGVRRNGRADEASEPVQVRSVEASSGAAMPIVQGGGATDARRLVDTAAEALESWSATAGATRAVVLRRLARRFREAADGDLPLIVARETGKRLVEARNEFRFSAQYFDLYARLAEDDTQPWWPGTSGSHLVRHRAVGVAAVVTPWNFPASIPARKLAPALAAGCTVVWKPSEVTAASSSLVAELVDECVPQGVTGMVLGAPEATTDAWLQDPRVRVLSFTGSTRVGGILAGRAAATFTRSVLELGGQAPVVLLEDAELETALETLAVAKFRNNGQSCIAANRAWVPRSRFDEVVDAFATRVKGLRVGDPLDADTELGPLALSGDRARLQELLTDAEANGARVVNGEAPDRGQFAPPALCIDPGDDARMLREEIFGPVLAISPYDDLEEVIRATNELPHGLAGYVCTANPLRGAEVAARLDVGLVGVNTGTPNRVDAPFGGRRASGWGYEGGPQGLEPFLAAQTVAMTGQPS